MQCLYINNVEIHSGSLWFCMQFAECLLLKEALPKKIGTIDVERQRIAEKLIELSGESFL